MLPYLLSHFRFFIDVRVLLARARRLVRADQLRPDLQALMVLAKITHGHICGCREVEEMAKQHSSARLRDTIAVGARKPTIDLGHRMGLAVVAKEVHCTCPERRIGASAEQKNVPRISIRGGGFCRCVQ